MYLAHISDKGADINWSLNTCLLSLLLKDVLDLIFLKSVARLFLDFGPVIDKTLQAVSVFLYRTCKELVFLCQSIVQFTSKIDLLFSARCLFSSMLFINSYGLMK